MKLGWRILIDAFQKETDTSTTGGKWALALALGATRTDQVLDEVIPLLSDRTLGENRAPLLAILARSKDPRALVLLQELSGDKDLGRT